jgi:acyl transferase domain-containing protein
MGAVLPGGAGLDAARRMLAGRGDAFGPVPAERWDWRRYHPGADGAADRTPCVRGAFLPEAADADGGLHRMEGALLAAAGEALADAGVGPGGLRGRRGAVIVGMMGFGTSSQRSAVFADLLPGGLAALRRSQAFAALSAAERSAVEARAEAAFRAGLLDGAGRADRRASVFTSPAAARVARLAGVDGPHRTVDAACASSFAALAEGLRGLQDGRYDTVLVGGSSPQITPLLLVGLGPLGVLGESVTPFRAAGGGTLLGEGATVLVLRRLEDALRGGDRVRAVIRGLGVAAATGRRALFTSCAAGQEAALRTAYARAGLGPEAVQYVEAHANGVPEGDRVEREALHAVFGPALRGGRQVALGSMKDRVGYLLSGAGTAGLVRTLLAMEDGILPHQAEEADADPAPAFGDGPLRLSTAPRPWEPAAPGLPRRAGVSAFGFGGVSFHLVLESFHADYHAGPFAPPRRRTLREAPVALLGTGTVLPGGAGADALWCALATGATRTGAARVEGFRGAPPRLRIPPRTAERMDPGHLWLLAAADDAVRAAGLTLPLPPRTGVFVAAAPGTPLTAALEMRVAYAEFDAALAGALAEAGAEGAPAAAIRAEAERAFKSTLPPFSEDALLGTLRSVAVGRLAQAVGAAGPCHALDAGRASAGAAMESAVRALLAGEIDTALVGAFWSGATPEYFLDGACGSAGVPAQGAAAVVLRRAADADDARVLIRGFGAAGVAGSADAAAECARDEAGAGAAEVAIPSVTHALGELMPAAGLAGLAGAVLALEHALVPPQPPSRAARPWPAASGTPRRAGLAESAACGVHYHLLVEAP